LRISYYTYNNQHAKNGDMGNVFEFEPIGDFVVIMPDPIETTTLGGVVIPESSANRAVSGVVIAVGPGCGVGSRNNWTPMQTKAGDRVVFGAYAEHVSLDGTEFVMIHESEIYTIVREKAV